MQIRPTQSKQPPLVTPLTPSAASITKLDKLVPPTKKSGSSAARFGIFYNENMKPWMLVAIAVLVLTLAAGGVVIIHNAQANGAFVAGASTDDVTQVLDKVGSLMILPQGEQPTVATVSDKDKLKDQPFFTSAENGDKVIIYPNAKKAILYRPSINKIVDVAPVSFGDTTN